MSTHTESSESRPVGYAAEVPPMMRAVVYRDYGDSSVLRPTRMTTPEAGDRQVLIRVSHAGVNPVDYRLRKGEARYLLPGGFPRVPGFDVAGEIVSPSQGEFRRGDRVMAFLDSPYGGGYAEYAKCGVKAVAKIPAAMSFEEAAAIPLAATTAMQCLRSIGKLKPGSRVLINGASGGVGSFAVQIAVAYGAYVTAVASGSHEQFVRSLGAHDFIDYHTTPLSELTQTWNIVFDVAGHSSYLEARDLLARDGIFVSTQPTPKGVAMTLLTLPLAKRGRAMLAIPDGGVLREVVRLYEEGKLRPIVDRVFPLAAAAEAHQLLENGVDHGKVVLAVA